MARQREIECTTVIKKDGRIIVGLKDGEAFKRLLQRPPKSPKLSGFPEFLSVDELADAIGRHKKTLYRAFKRGGLPGARKIGGVIAIRKDIFLQAWETGTED